MATRQQLNAWVKSGLLEAFAEGKELQVAEVLPSGKIFWNKYKYEEFPRLDADLVDSALNRYRIMRRIINRQQNKPLRRSPRKSTVRKYRRLRFWKSCERLNGLANRD